MVDAPMSARIESLCRMLTRALGVWICLLGPSLVRAEDPWQASVALTTDYIQRGLSQTRGDPSLQGSLYYQHASGLYAGVAAASIDTSWPDYRLDGARTELEAQAGLLHALDQNWSLQIGITRYAYPDDEPYLDYDYTEVEMAVGFRELARVSVAVLDGVSMVSHAGIARDRRSFAYELALQQPLTERFALTAGAGYHDLDDLYATGYGYWNLGAVARLGPVTVSVGHYWVDDTARELFGTDLADDRFALTLLFAL